MNHTDFAQEFPGIARHYPEMIAQFADHAERIATGEITFGDSGHHDSPTHPEAWVPASILARYNPEAFAAVTLARDSTAGPATPEGITHMLHARARVNGTTFAQEYANYHPERH